MSTMVEKQFSRAFELFSRRSPLVSVDMNYPICLISTPHKVHGTSCVSVLLSSLITVACTGYPESAVLQHTPLYDILVSSAMKSRRK